MTIGLTRQVGLLESLLVTLKTAEVQVADVVSLEGTSPGGDDAELRGIMLQLRTIHGQVSGMVTARTVQKDGR